MDEWRDGRKKERMKEKQKKGWIERGRRRKKESRKNTSKQGKRK